MNHVGDPKQQNPTEEDDIPLSENSLIGFGKNNRPKLMICITMYNEPYKQILESLAGLYRAYYELVGMDKSYRNRVHICIIADGYEKLTIEFLK
jgi:hypothetical protein